MVDIKVADNLSATRATQSRPILSYQTGFGNELESEAIAGALPKGQNSPQRPAFGLVSELVSGTTFSAPRALNRRTYLFRIHPSTVHGSFVQVDSRRFLTPPLPVPPSPNQMRWGPFAIPANSQDFIDGMTTICGNGSPALQIGMSIHVYLATANMQDRYFANADGEMLILPEKGVLLIATELGQLEVSVGELAVIPRGIKFRVELTEGSSRGFVCENFGLPFRLPELGLIGSNGLANACDFQIPTAQFEDSEVPCQLVQKYGGALWSAALPHSPLDVVAWRGNYLPAKFDMHNFVAMGTATVDHPDPSIFCALTSPSDSILGGNADLMILPPRWIVAEHTFRPPGFHRNCVAEYLGIITGHHEAKAHGFQPGGASLHNNWSPHGPDTETLEAARVAPLEARKVKDSLVFMFESRMPLQLSEVARDAPELQLNYRDCWQDFQRTFRSES